MRLKEVWLLGILILATLVCAAPNAVINLAPVSLYESNELLFNLTVNNWFGNEVIEEVKINMPGFTITDVADFFGWENNVSANEIRWYNGDIETNAYDLFQFNAKAPIVDDDKTVDVEIITIGEDETVDTVHLEIINDDTPPSLSNNIPADGGFLREGVTDQDVLIEAEDPETGIKNASFSYWDCSPNSTAVVNTAELTCNSGICSTELDLSEFREGDSMCFEFTVYNNAEDSSKVDGTIGFDGTPPSVQLVAPENNAYSSSSTLFSFNATDNLAPTLDCEFIIDNNIIASTTANNSQITSETYDMSSVDEGSHEWKVTCTDWVGLSADSEERSIIVDKTAPSITLNSPSNNSMIGDNVMIGIDVTDNYAVADVDYSISLNSSELPEGENTLVVTAADEAGNIAVAEFKFIVDKTPPSIDLISPEDQGTSDVHVSFVFDTDDNLDNTLECTIYINNEAKKTQEVDIDDTANITIILPISDYEWYVSCKDDAGNAAQTGSRALSVIDLTGPDIVSDITYVARTEDYPFDISVSDISGVDSVEAVFNNTLLELASSGDIYSGIITTDLAYPLGNYALEIEANDTLGNPSSLADSFTLIQGYAITLNLNPSSIEAGKEVIASGTVTLDDGGAVPEGQITLYLPGQAVNAAIENGAYSYAFNAPGSAGTYTIKSSIVSSEGFEHYKTADLEVISISGSAGHHISSSGGGMYCGDGSCQSFETCSSCPDDCGQCPSEENNDNGFAGGINTTEEVPEEEPREPASTPAIGAASSWFNDMLTSPLWILLLLILISLYIMSKKSAPVNSKINWKGYFERNR